jgi:hypothetical protein
MCFLPVVVVEGRACLVGIAVDAFARQLAVRTARDDFVDHALFAEAHAARAVAAADRGRRAGCGEAGGGGRPGAQFLQLVGRRRPQLAGQRIAHDDHAFLAGGLGVHRKGDQHAQGGQRTDGEQFFLGHGFLPFKRATGGAAG